ncbi:hypothetical protein XELAEV_18024872mg [Xenopus laevis]|uniref:Multifunctional methyltransferase subunit TRM112-like protein n=1 Tax=Xenopus laevis TaxID=8355 RepID=A0A974D120_XENLA|nr:hypothetical protein XELAEV_18024872mg [Xenopus laevis]
MKLLMHNMLRAPLPGSSGDFVCSSSVEEVKLSSVDLNQDFVTRMIPKLEWEALLEAAESLGHGSDLPLKKVHSVLLEVELIEGALKCPESGTEFPITRGIPNM